MLGLLNIQLVRLSPFKGKFVDPIWYMKLPVELVYYSLSVAIASSLNCEVLVWCNHDLFYGRTLKKSCLLWKRKLQNIATGFIDTGISRRVCTSFVYKTLF